MSDVIFVELQLFNKNIFRFKFLEAKDESIGTGKSSNFDSIINAPGHRKEETVQLKFKGKDVGTIDIVMQLELNNTTYP